MTIAAQSVDRLDQVPARLHFLFDYSAPTALGNPAIRSEAIEARPVLAALADELAKSGPLTDKETFRALAARVREKTGAKGKALFHPIRVALTGRAEGPELDLAVPAIDSGADLPPDAGIPPIIGCRERATAFVSVLEKLS